MPRQQREPEYIQEGEREILLEAIQTRIKYLISDVGILMDHGGQPQIAAALYIHAVEEYGKFLYVKSLQAVQGIITIDMNKFTWHDEKIRIAKEALPSDCFVLKHGSFTSSGFTRSSFNVHEVPDWKTRLTIFNTDIQNGRVEDLPEVNAEVLRNAVNEFKSHFRI